MLMKKILLIGGTDTHRGMLKAALDEAGYRTSAAVTRRYTNTWLAHRIKPFDMIIYDTEEAERAPDFFKEMRDAAPPTIVVVLTSVFDSTDYAALGVKQTLRRPYTLGDVIDTARELFS
jgi:DNA-binding NtrC family response regulator